MTEPTNQPKPEEAIEVHHAATEEALAQQQGISPPPAGDEPPAPPAPVEPKEQPLQDGGRSAIAERFKKLRVDKEPPVDTTGDFIHPSQTYGQVAAEQQQADTQQQDKPPAPPPSKLKLKVRGQEREVDRDEAVKMAKVVAGDDDVSALSDDQLTRLAQLGAAGQSYLDETKQVLETTKRVQVSRQHPDEPQPATLATEQDDPDDQQHPADPIEDIVQQLQYGDPKEAGQKLRTTIAEIATSAVKQATVTDRVQQDIASDLRVHDDFLKKNAAIAADPIAAAVIRDQFLNGYRDDLRRIGVPEENIPTDPSQLANHHRHYKLQGQPVRQVSQLLNDAAASLQNWRGTRTEPNPTPDPATRIDVKVNRDDRRMAIPHQPTRAAVQPSLTQPTQPGPKSRHDAVKEAQRARGQAV